MYIADGHAVVPSSLPQMRIFAVNALGVVVIMGGPIGGTGWQTIVTPASAAAYNLSTTTITYLIGPDSLGLPIDRSNFTYMAEIVDEAGLGALGGTAFDGIECTFTGISDLSPQ